MVPAARMAPRWTLFGRRRVGTDLPGGGPASRSAGDSRRLAGPGRQKPPETQAARRLHRLEVTSAVLGLAPRVALGGLLPYIAVKRLGASLSWVGVMNAAVYTGFLWNGFFSSVTARVSLKRSVVLLLLLSSCLLAVAAFQRAIIPYGLAVVLLLFVGGLTNAQYDTLLVHLYDERERPKKLSFRWMAVSAGGALLAPLFGRLGELGVGHWPALLLAALITAAGSMLFSRVPAGREHGMDAFAPIRLLALVVEDRRFLKLVVVLVLYGWFGTGIGTIDVLLYRRYGLGELAVGLLSGATTLGMIVAAVAITPFLRFRGGLSSFRLCLTTSALSSIILALAGVLDAGRAGVLLVAAGNFAYGIGATGFTIASQTSSANLAGGRDVALYVNSFKFFQGVRGIAFPLVVSWAVVALPQPVHFSIAVGLTVLCAAASWWKGADSRSGAPRRAQSSGRRS